MTERGSTNGRFGIEQFAQQVRDWRRPHVVPVSSVDHLLVDIEHGYRCQCGEPFLSLVGVERHLHGLVRLDDD